MKLKFRNFKKLSLLKFKCWYYETAMKDGNEDAINAMLPDKLPKIYRNYMTKGMTDFLFLHQTEFIWKILLSIHQEISFVHPYETKLPFFIIESVELVLCTNSNIVP